MQNRLVVLEDKLLTRKRFIIETIVDQFKKTSQFEHTRHRSTADFIVNLFAGLISCTWQAKKPSFNLSDKDMAFLPALFLLRIRVKEDKGGPRSRSLVPGHVSPRPGLSKRL